MKRHENAHDLHPVQPSVHEVAVEYIQIGSGWQPGLLDDVQQIEKLTYSANKY